MKPAELPLSRAKTIIPGRRPEIVSRARLLAKMDELLEKQLVFVTAPAGYGKTSLLVDLASSTGMPVCWLSLDALDQEPQRFLAYFLASISQKFPRFGNQSNAALNDIIALENNLENLIITIVNEIDEHIREHFIIVLDDYQFVDGVPEIRHFVGRFVQLAGENCHLILASRRLPTLPDLPVLVARQQVGGFDLHELAFRSDEILLLFEKGYSVKLSEADVEELERRTEGWVTGLLLAQLGSIRGLPDLTHAARAVGVDLSDYFDQQVLSQQIPQVRSFLLQTSLLEEFDAALCDSILGVGDWRTIMSAIRRSNLFVLSLGPRGEWMRYHALFRDFLQQRIRQESPETMQAILLRLAEVSEENGDLEKAHYALRRVGNQEVLAALVGRAGTALIENGRMLTLSAWLDELPEPLFQQNPPLLLQAGIVSLVKGQVQYGLSLINQAEAMFRTVGDQTNTAIALLRRSWAYRLSGGYQPAVADADEAIQLVTGKREQEHILAEAQRMKGLALFRLGEVQESEKCIKLALEIFVRLGREKSISLAQMELGMTRRVLGDAASAQVYYEKALAEWQEEGNLTSQATLLNNLGVLYRMRGEYERAIKAFEKGLDCARRSGYMRSQALILASMGDLYTDVGDLEAAGLIHQQAYEIAIQTADFFLTNYSRISLAAIFRLRGDFEQSRLLLQDAGASLRDTGSHSEVGLHALESGRLQLGLGQPDQAIPKLRGALEHFIKGGMRVESTWVRLWLTAALVEAGEFGAANAEMEATLRPAEEGDLSPSLLPAGLQVRSWLSTLAKNDEAEPHLSSFLEKVAAFQKQLPSLRIRLRSLTSMVPASVPDLVIRAFGRPQVRVKGHTLTNAQWQTKSVKELFFLFVQAPGPLSKEQVGEMLWPESAPEQLKLRFKNELYRLRRAVGQNTVLFDGSTYRFNHNLDFEFDVDIFENNLRRARTAQDAEEKLRAYQEAVAVVRGKYLEEVDSTWVLADRGRYFQDYLDALLSLAGLLLERKETEEALKICQYALAADKGLEEGYRLMMRIHAARGDRMGITHLYQACHAALEEELGMTPSVETEALYHQLTS
jgi:LuxR family maltose regulon positive regulatory protein